VNCAIMLTIEVMSFSEIGSTPCGIGRRGPKSAFGWTEWKRGTSAIACLWAEGSWS